MGFDEEMSNYRELDIWEESCFFAKRIYETVETWKDFGLRDQMTRSAVSIASNIAEGSERESDADFVRFLRIAKGSSAECRTQLKIAHMSGKIGNCQFRELDSSAITLNKRIGALIRYLRKTKDEGRRTKDEGQKTKD
jgi:four helix bundle protein